MSFDLKIVSGDLNIKNGDLSVVINEDKLIQDILKICLTSAGSNPFQPWYGSYISRSIIGSALDPDITMNLAKSQLQNALENLKKVQELQVATGQKITPQEQLAFISDISILRSTSDPRLISVFIQVLSRSFKRVDTSFVVNNILP